MARILVADTVMIDEVLKIPTLPQPSGDVAASERKLLVGGGFNVMSAAQRLGAQVIYAGELGWGPMANLAQTTLRSSNISFSESRTSDDLGVCLVLVDPQGERTFITSPGAELTVSLDTLKASNPKSGDVVYFSGYDFVYPRLATVMMEWFSQLDSDVVVAFDPGPRGSDIPTLLMEKIISRTDWLLTNEFEAGQFGPGKNLSTLALEISTRLRGGVVFRTGASGCVVAYHGRVEEVSGFEARVVDTNGAGDVHNGVFLASLMEGRDPFVAALWANAAAALAIEVLGGASGPTREELERKLQRS